MYENSLKIELAIQRKSFPYTMESIFINCLTIAAQNGYQKEVKPFLTLSHKTWEDVQIWAAVKDLKLGPWQRTHLMYAAMRGNIARMRWLLARGAQLELKDCQGKTALAVASEFGHLEMVRELITRGASVNTGNKCCTPLYAASMRGHIQVVRELLARGALLNEVSWYNSLDVSCSEGHVEVVRELFANGAVVNDFGILYSACENGHVEVVRELLLHNAHRIAFDVYDWRDTPLHISIYKRHLNVVRLLLTHHAYLHDDNWRRESPLCVASGCGNLEMVQSLLSVGASVHSNPSPLFAACAEGHLNIVQELLTHGADIDYGDNHDGPYGGYHVSPLEIARRGRHIEVVNFLIARGAV